ncbi:ankyrin repeat domain-containing protein 16 [Ciona intestinalis]
MDELFGLSYIDTCSAVGLAARNGNVELLKMLLLEKKDYCVKDNRGWFPIHEAASKGHTECVQLLIETALENGEVPSEIWPLPFDVMAAGSPLCLAVAGGHLNTVEILLTLCQTNEPDICDALMRSVHYPDILKLMLSKFPGILVSEFICDGSDGSPLHAAVTHENLESVKVLLRSGIGMELIDDFGRTALHIAVCIKDTLNRIAITNILLDNHCNVNARDEKHFTPLYLAVQRDYTEIIQLLFNHNADPHLSAMCNFGKHDIEVSPIAAAAYLGNLQAVKLLVQYTNKKKLGELKSCSPVSIAVQGACAGCLLALLDAGYTIDGLLPDCTAADLTDTLYYGEDILYNLLPWCFELVETAKVLEILLSRGAALSGKFVDKSMFIPLMISSEQHSFYVLKVLLKYGLHEKMLNNELPSSAQKIHVKFFNVLQSSLLSSNEDDENDENENINIKKLNLLFSVIPNISFKVCSNSLDFTHAEIAMVAANLQELCRWTIRQTMLQNTGLSAINMLNIPPLLKRYLFYSDLNSM